MRAIAYIFVGLFAFSLPALSQNHKSFNFDVSPSWLIEEYGSAIVANGELIASEKAGAGISKDGEIFFLCSKSNQSLLVGIKLRTRLDSLSNATTDPLTLVYNDRGTERSAKVSVILSERGTELNIFHKKSDTTSSPNSYDDVILLMNAISGQDVTATNIGSISIKFKTISGDVYSGFLGKNDAKYKVVNHCYSIKPK